MTAVDEETTAAYDYALDPAAIAQQPVEPRDAARLLVCRAGSGERLAEAQVRDLPAWLRPGDLLVLNRTRVIPARLPARKASGARSEVLLVHPEADPICWTCLIKGRVHPGDTVVVSGTVPAIVERCDDDGARVLRFPAGTDVVALAERTGAIPLPPYIRRDPQAGDRDRYQSIFATVPGSVAAPTASLHFTQDLLDRVTAGGVGLAWVELAIGPGTFKPVDTARLSDHRLHAEACTCPAATVEAITACRARGGRVVAVGTTVVRTLETAVRQPGGLAAWNGWTRLFLHPPARFQVVDALLTNFHLPRSSLLMLVACLTGRAALLARYAEAQTAGYRFFSYGDAMLICPA